jgi:hypothetical protein
MIHQRSRLLDGAATATNDNDELGYGQDLVRHGHIPCQEVVLMCAAP